MRTAPESCSLVRAHKPKAKSRIGRYSLPAVGSALSALSSIQSTDRVGPSSKPEKTTTDRPVPALHSAGSAPCSGDLLPPARGRSSSDTARSARSTTGSRFGSRSPVTPVVRTPPRFLPEWLAEPLASLSRMRRGPRGPEFHTGGRVNQLCSRRHSSSFRHSWSFNLPFARFQSNSSHTVRAISVIPKPA